MVAPADDDKTKLAGARHLYGPRPLGGVLAPLLRPAFRRRGAATAQLIADWEAVVGPALAALTTPRLLSGSRLTIACTGPVALELQHLSAALIGRINAHLGKEAVTTLRFVQARREAPPSPPPPPARAVAEAARAVAELPEGPLRDALQRLGAAVLADRS
jgi:hypothetical protein